MRAQCAVGSTCITFHIINIIVTWNERIGGEAKEEKNVEYRSMDHSVHVVRYGLSLSLPLPVSVDAQTPSNISNWNYKTIVIGEWDEKGYDGEYIDRNA